jgi:hypothetical protein
VLEHVKLNLVHEDCDDLPLSARVERELPNPPARPTSQLSPMPRFGLLKLRPWGRKPSSAPSPPLPPTSVSAESSASTSLNTYPSRCLYCPKSLASEAARSKHLATSQTCKAVIESIEESARQRRAEERERGEPLELRIQARACTQTDPLHHEAPRKRRRLDVVDGAPANQPTPADQEQPKLPAPVTNQPVTEAVLPSTTSTSTPEPGRSPDEGQGMAAGRPNWVDQVTGWYIEPFPDPLAGAPISDEVLPPIDLEIYMRSCGEMAKPDNFEMAELLLTTGLTDAGKNQHLRSVLVSNTGTHLCIKRCSRVKGIVPWQHNTVGKYQYHVQGRRQFAPWAGLELVRDC